MASKGKGKGEGKGEKGKQNQRDILYGKSYKDAVHVLCEKTAVQLRDIDQKAVQLLDEFEKTGRAEEALGELATQLEGIVREKVQNWKAYTYALLRKVDEGLYKGMKERSEGTV